MIRGVQTEPQSRLHPLALLEDAESIQAALMEILNALVRNTIDFRRAQLMLRTIHIATKNAPHAKFDVYQDQIPRNQRMVSDIPDYPSAPALPNSPTLFLTQAAALLNVNRPEPHELPEAEIEAFQVALAGALVRSKLSS